MDVEGDDQLGMRRYEEVGPSHLLKTFCLNRCCLGSDSLWERIRSRFFASFFVQFISVFNLQVTKPLPPSQLGERRFPDQNPAGPAMSPYYPGLGGGSQASTSITQCYLLPCITTCHPLLPSITQHNPELPCTLYYPVPSIIQCHPVLPSVTQSCPVLPSITVYPVLPTG